LDSYLAGEAAAAAAAGKHDDLLYKHYAFIFMVYEMVRRRCE